MQDEFNLNDVAVQVAVSVITGILGSFWRRIVNFIRVGYFNREALRRKPRPERPALVFAGAVGLVFTAVVLYLDATQAIYNLYLVIAAVFGAPLSLYLVKRGTSKAPSVLGFLTFLVGAFAGWFLYQLIALFIAFR